MIGVNVLIFGDFTKFIKKQDLKTLKKLKNF